MFGVFGYILYLGELVFGEVEERCFSLDDSIVKMVFFLLFGLFSVIYIFFY